MSYVYIFYSEESGKDHNELCFAWLWLHFYRALNLKCWDVNKGGCMNRCLENYSDSLIIFVKSNFVTLDFFQVEPVFFVSWNILALLKFVCFQSFNFMLLYNKILRYFVKLISLVTIEVSNPKKWSFIMQKVV